MTASASIGILCTGLQSIFGESSSADIFSGSGFTLTDNLNQLVNVCIPEAIDEVDSTLFYKVVPDFENSEILLEGLTIFENFRSNLTALPIDAISVTNTTKNWDFYKSGYLSNFENVETALTEMNQILKCENQYMVLNQFNCTEAGSFSCLVLSDVSTPYEPPDCVESSSDTLNYFSRLRTYFSNNNELIGNMVKDMEGEENTTPNSKYKLIVSDMKETETFHVQIKSKLINTMNTASQFKSGLSDFANCNILRETAYDIEVGICFDNLELSGNVFFFILAATVFLTIFNFSIFCAVRNIKPKSQVRKMEDSDINFKDFEEEEIESRA